MASWFACTIEAIETWYSWERPQTVSPLCTVTVVSALAFAEVIRTVPAKAAVVAKTSGFVLILISSSFDL